MTDHSPAPWRVLYDGDVIDEHKLVNWPWRIAAADGKHVVDLVECATSAADIDLIVSAPKLRARLKELHAANERLGRALAKALTDLESEHRLAIKQTVLAAQFEECCNRHQRIYNSGLAEGIRMQREFPIMAQTALEAMEPTT